MKWPKWINIEMFKKDVKNTIYVELNNQISTLLYYGDIIFDINIIDKLKIINLDKVELVFSFAAYNDDKYLMNTNIRDNGFYKHFNMELHLPDIIIDYFKRPLQFLFEKYVEYNSIIERNILNLLYVRDYTYQSCLEV